MTSLVKWLAHQSAAALVRYAIVAIITAVFLAYNFSPNEWLAALISEPPAWLASDFTRLVVVIVGFVVVGALLFVPGLVGTGSGRRRRLSEKQKKALVSALIDRKFVVSELVILFTSSGGDESREYAEDFADAMRRLNWTDTTRIPIDDDPHLTGLRLWYDPEKGKDPNAKLMADALEKVGIEFDWQLHEGPYSGTVLFVYRKNNGPKQARP